jgi:2-oxoglutarate/2-oxoacid ferredoxin oxidoreductase subunit alpha
MRLNVLIGGKAGQGINKVSGIVTESLMRNGYYTFNYRDYPSIIRGGHNFNVLSISDKPIMSHESRLDVILAMDSNTIKVHSGDLRKGGLIIGFKDFLKFGINLNVALSGALMKVLGVEKKIFLDVVKNKIKGKDGIDKSLEAGEYGFESQVEGNKLKKLKNKITLLSGSRAIAIGAINSDIDIYFAYPMTPATNALHELASRQMNYNYLTFQAENEISVVNMALGASFSGAKVMVGTSGGGFDLMTEGLSMQGISEIPLVVYLASRVGPGTGLPTYNMQGDLDIALRGGHGEFPRVVISPGDPVETIEKVNEAFYLSQKFNALSILLSDKHVAESEFTSSRVINKPLKVKVVRKVPGEVIVKASSYECDEYGLTTESADIAVRNVDARLKKYEDIKKECKKFEMVKLHGKKDSKNLIVGWGSTKGAIIDAISDLDFKFLQVMYLKPLSDEIRKEIERADKVILIESNVTGQLGRLIRERTGIKIDKRILKYDGRPFRSDELKKKLMSI